MQDRALRLEIEVIESMEILLSQVLHGGQSLSFLLGIKKLRRNCLLIVYESEFLRRYPLDLFFQFSFARVLHALLKQERDALKLLVEFVDCFLVFVASLFQFLHIHTLSLLFLNSSHEDCRIGEEFFDLCPSTLFEDGARDLPVHAAFTPFRPV